MLTLLQGSTLREIFRLVGLHCHGKSYIYWFVFMTLKLRYIVILRCILQCCCKFCWFVTKNVIKLGHRGFIDNLKMTCWKHQISIILHCMPLFSKSVYEFILAHGNFFICKEVLFCKCSFCEGLYIYFSKKTKFLIMLIFLF